MSVFTVTLPLGSALPLQSKLYGIGFIARAGYWELREDPRVRVTDVEAVDEQAARELVAGALGCDPMTLEVVVE